MKKTKPIKKVKDLKTSKELLDELSISNRRSNAILNRIKSRAKELCVEYPNIPIKVFDHSMISGDIIKPRWKYSFSQMVYIDVIQQIESFNHER